MSRTTVNASAEKRLSQGHADRPRGMAVPKLPVRPAQNAGQRLEKSTLLKKVFVDDGGRFSWKLSPFLQQSFDVFPYQV